VLQAVAMVGADTKNHLVTPTGFEPVSRP
jgi:hypothetical protein